jgi:hypothetical protein
MHASDFPRGIGSHTSRWSSAMKVSPVAVNEMVLGGHGNPLLKMGKREL